MSIVGGYVPTGSLGGVDFGIFPHSDASGFRFGLGVAPFVRLGNSVVFDPNYTNPSYPTMLSAGYAANARISTNSWGAPVAGAYNIDSQTYDGLVRDAQAGTAGTQQMVIVFSAGNAGSAASTVGSPGTAKNVITVGAAENVQPFGGADGCGISDRRGRQRQRHHLVLQPRADDRRATQARPGRSGNARQRHRLRHAHVDGQCDRRSRAIAATASAAALASAFRSPPGRTGTPRRRGPATRRPPRRAGRR